MIVKLLTSHHLEFLSCKGGCRGSSKSTLVKMSNCWESYATAQMCLYFFIILVPMNLPLEQKCLMFGACFMVVSTRLKLNVPS